MQLIVIDETTSTNSYLAEIAPAVAHGTAVMALRQTAGRGQRGNSWESAPGLNVSMSLLLRPEGLDVRRAFTLSEAVAVGCAEALQRLIANRECVELKWPNDIYVGDRKLGGILIENALSGAMVRRSIVGVGVNVNQSEFLSDAPNPVSLSMLGVEGLEPVEVADALRRSMVEAVAEPAEAIHSRYMALLWRRKGMYPYLDVATGRRFMARIDAVAPSGHITLVEADGSSHSYAFKEIASIL